MPFLILFVFSCGQADNKSNSRNTSVQNNAVDVRLTGSKPEDKFFSKVFRDVKFLPLETSKQSFLSFVSDLLYYKGNYFIKDNSQQSIFCFDEGGKFKFKIFPKGKGPLELNDITDFTVNTRRETLDVFDFSLGKLVSFDLSGTPVREKRFNYYLREFACTSTGDYVIYAPDLINDKTTTKIKPGAFIVDSLGNYKYSFLNTSVTGTYTQPINCLSGYGDSIVLVSNYTKDVYLVNNETISKVFSLQFSEDWVLGMITSNSSGGRLNINYRKDVTSGKGYPVYLNIKDHSQLHLENMFNDLFLVPVMIPYFYKNAGTMVGFLTPLDIRKINDYLKIQAAKDRANPRLTGEIIALSQKLSEYDNPVLIEFNLKD